MGLDVLLEETEWYKHESEELAKRAIRSGKNVSDEFWEELLRVFNDRRAVARLFDVSPDKVSYWSSKISKYLSEVNKEVGKERKKIIKTGYSQDEEFS